MRWPNNSSSVWETQIGEIDLLVQDWVSFCRFFRSFTSSISLIVSNRVHVTDVLFNDIVLDRFFHSNSRKSITRPLIISSLHFNFLFNLNNLNLNLFTTNNNNRSNKSTTTTIKLPVRSYIPNSFPLHSGQRFFLRIRNQRS